nr:PREDICTED: piggyBac transposable element-derived protein 4-like [Megachile rotundata]
MTRNKRLSLAEHWSRDKLLRSDIFNDIMNRDRYFLLLRMLYFSDDQAFSSDRLHKIRKIIDELRAAFSNVFYPYSNLCIDERLLLYKGRLSFKQFIPSKRNRFGIKSFVLCDCKRGYIQDFIVYTGGDATIGPENKDYGKSGSIVMYLLEPYLGKGHTLYVVNWYTSPALFDVLHKNDINACGTVKKRRNGMPKMDE